MRILLFALLITPIISHSQEKEVFGRILDAENQKPIYGANVIVLGTTQGTTTNQLGYFKFSIPSDKAALVFSHIGYQTLKVEIPVSNKFLLKINRDFQELNPLDIKYFEVKDLPTIKTDSIQLIGEIQEIEKNAEYPGGWTYFYNDIVKIIKIDSIYKALADSTFHLRFAVEIDGYTTFVSLTPEDQIAYQALKRSEKNFSKWNSASQNGRKVIQYFDLPIRNFEEVFTVIEETARPVGGMPAFYNYVKKELKYPKEAKRKGIEGKVFVQFVINKDGSISDIKVIQGLGYGCDEEAIRIVSISPNWVPGNQRGKPVKQRYTLPIIFKDY